MVRNTSLTRHNAMEIDCEAGKKLFRDPGLNATKERNAEESKSQRASVTSSTYVENIDLQDASDIKTKEPSINANGYQLMTRRITVAGGFLDIALFTANCEQLKFVLELGYFHVYYKHVVGLLITSLLLQLLVGFTLFLLGCKVVKKTSDEVYYNFLNHVIMILVTLITIVNTFISTFGPKGTIMARCLGAFAYPNVSGPMWNSYLNYTRNYMVYGNVS